MIRSIATILILSLFACHSMAANTLAPARLNLKPVQLNTATKPILTFKTNPVLLKKLKPITPNTKEPTGPNPEAYISLVNHLDQGDIKLLEDLESVVGWDPNMILQDKTSGNTFYYLPKEFRLAFSEESYGLGIQYNAASESGQPSVLITAELSAPYQTGDAVFLKKVLQQALDVQSDINIRDVGGAGITVDLDALSTGLSVPADRIHAQAPKHLRENIRLTFNLTQDEVEAVFAQMAHEGISGSITVPVNKTSLTIPWNIQFKNVSGDPIKGFKSWWLNNELGKQLSNLTAYPVTVSGISGYRLENGSLERISKAFAKSFEIKPGDDKKFALPKARSVLGNDVIIAWLDTSWESDCDACAKTVRGLIERGVGAAATTPVSFEAIPAIFEDNDIYKLVISVKSPYFIADGSKITAKEVVLTEDENLQTLNIFYPEGKDEPLLYKFKVKIVYNSGKTVQSGSWIKSKDLDQMFGSYQLEQLMGDKE